MLLAGATFLTRDSTRPRVEALLVRDGVIVATGSYSELRAQAPFDEVHDLGGGFALPGFVDAHGHLLALGQAEEMLDLRSARSVDDVVRSVSNAPRIHGWVRGRAWSDSSWPRSPAPDDLESAARGDRVWLERVDSHAIWVNERVLRDAGIGRDTPDPSGGRIERAPDGRPTGVLVDRALEVVEPLLPADTEADVDRQLALAAKRCASLGLVGIHDAGIDANIWAGLERLELRGELPLRVYGLERQADADVEHVLARGPRLPAPKGRLTLRGVKFFLDGALGSRGAAFFEPYADGVGGSGLLLEEREALIDQLVRRMNAGFQVALHAIGDRANALAIDAIREAVRILGKDGKDGNSGLRPRIEHVQHVRLADVAKMAAAGIVASMQPMHYASDWPWARARLGRARLAGAYAWRSVLDAGVPLAFGSDFPIEDANPLLGLRAATSRKADVSQGEPDQTLSLDEALAAFTSGPAYAAFEERVSGKLAAGFRADLTVLDRDPHGLAQTPDELPRLRVLATVIDGALRAA